MKQTGVENNPAFRQLVRELDPKSMAGKLAELAGKEQKDFIRGLAEEQNDRQKEDAPEEYQEQERDLNISGFDEGIEEEEHNGVVRGFPS